MKLSGYDLNWIKFWDHTWTASDGWRDATFSQHIWQAINTMGEDKRNKIRTVELVKSTYQPTKAEKEEEISLDIPGETIADRMRNLAKAVKGPVNIRLINRPRTRS